jgi:hypothetical protein
MMTDGKPVGKPFWAEFWEDFNVTAGPSELLLPEELDIYELTKDEPAGPDPSQYEEDQDIEFDLPRFMAVVINSTKVTQSFLRHQHDSNSTAWERLCLGLQRTARGAPALASSAFVSAKQTPKEYRVSKADDAIKGMLGYSWNPDSPGAGHVFEVAGRLSNGTMITWTNDARGAGQVDLVDIGFYGREWGHVIQFFAWWVNGFAFPDFEKTPVVRPNPVHLDGHFNRSVRELKEAIKYGREHGEFKRHPIIERKLENQLDRMIDVRDRIRATHKK